MSPSEKISIMYVVVLYSIIDKYAKKEKEVLLQKYRPVLSLYQQEIEGKEYDRILSVLYAVEDAISNSGVIATYKFVYAIAGNIAERFMEYCNGIKYTRWKEFYGYVATHKALKSGSTKSFDNAEKIMEILYNFELKMRRK